LFLLVLFNYLLVFSPVKGHYHNKKHFSFDLQHS